MMYQFQDRKKINKRSKIIIFIVLFLVIFYLFYLFDGFLNIFGKPIWKVQNNIINKVDNSGYIFRSKSSLFYENENLLKENTDLKISMIDYQTIKKENIELKELLGYIPTDNNFILSSILTKPNHSPYDTMIIDIGENLGVEEGSVVYFNTNIPLGKINKVYENTSLVTLFSNSGEITEGVIDGSNASVELIGRGGGNFEMNIPYDLPVENGTLVMSPGMNLEVIAIVDSSISLPSDPIKKVILRSPVNIQNIKWVEVKKN